MPRCGPTYKLQFIISLSAVVKRFARIYTYSTVSQRNITKITFSFHVQLLIKKFLLCVTEIRFAHKSIMKQKHIQRNGNVKCEIALMSCIIQQNFMKQLRHKAQFVQVSPLYFKSTHV